MGDDVQSIIINFGYTVLLNSNDPFFSSLENCKVLFPSSILTKLGDYP
jgi:hypothetical protein